MKIGSGKNEWTIVTVIIFTNKFISVSPSLRACLSLVSSMYSCMHISMSLCIYANQCISLPCIFFLLVFPYFFVIKCCSVFARIYIFVAVNFERRVASFHCFHVTCRVRVFHAFFYILLPARFIFLAKMCFIN